MTVPKWFRELDIGCKPEYVTNPWSGESILLSPEALAVYDFLLGCEATGNYDNYYEAREYFAERWLDAYRVLVD